MSWTDSNMAANRVSLLLDVARICIARESSVKSNKIPEETHIMAVIASLPQYHLTWEVWLGDCDGEERHGTRHQRS